MTTEKTNCLVCDGDGYTVEKIRSTIFNESFPMGEEKIPCKSCNENGTA
jgi:RecJ-like exonuclease